MTICGAGMEVVSTPAEEVAPSSTEASGLANARHHSTDPSQKIDATTTADKLKKFDFLKTTRPQPAKFLIRKKGLKTARAWSLARSLLSKTAGRKAAARLLRSLKRHIQRRR